MGIENHVVVGPDEFDYEPKCDHEEWSIVEIEDRSEEHIDFKIRCDICGHEGYRSYEMKFHDMVWD